MQRGRPALVAVLIVVVAATSTQPVGAQAPGERLVEVCTDAGVPGIPELGPRTCKSFAAGSVLFAKVCGQLPVDPAVCASLTDGIVIDPAAVDAFVASWAGRALRLQDRLDDAEPLRNTLWLHTHNTANSSAYPPSLSSTDPNQRYTILDQLRMGVRAIELDLHVVGGQVVLCHGRSENFGPVIIHLGCSVDRPIAAGLAELAAFLDAPGNEHEFVLLYLENQLDDDPAAHDKAAGAIEAAIGDLVVPTPAGQPCATMPLDATVDQLRSAGHRVLIVGNCSPGRWGALVHERGPEWDETGSGGQGFPSGDRCLTARESAGYDARWIRIYEDSTWLSAMVGGVSPPLSSTDVANMVACGVDMIGFDRLVPGDGRLEAMIWSWAPDEPVDHPARRCAARGADGRFRMRACNEAMAYSCRTATGWMVPGTRGPWQDGGSVCAAADATFATPPTGWENSRLGSAAAPGAVELWIPIGEPASTSTPMPAAPAGAGPSGAGSPTLPSTGGDPNAPLVVLVLGGAAAAAASAASAARRGR